MGFLMDALFEKPKGDKKREPSWLDAFVEFPKDDDKKTPKPKAKK